MAIYLGIKEVKDLAIRVSDIVGYDFLIYNVGFLKRRFLYCFESLNIRKVDAFLNSLKNDQFKDLFLYTFSVCNTEVFRDPSFWRMFRDKVLKTHPKEKINIWLPDLSSPEEIYSLLILLHSNKLLKKCRIICSHPSILKLDDLRNYRIGKKQMEQNVSNLKRVDEKIDIYEYFIEKDSVYLFKIDLLDKVETDCCFFVGSNIDVKLDIIIFRNSLLYYNRDFHSAAVELLTSKLDEDGYLCIGIQEQLLNLDDCELHNFDLLERVFVKSLIPKL